MTFSSSKHAHSQPSPSQTQKKRRVLSLSTRQKSSFTSSTVISTSVNTAANSTAAEITKTTIVDCTSNGQNTTAECPICQLDISRMNEMDAQSHVNQCLDGGLNKSPAKDKSSAAEQWKEFFRQVRTRAGLTFGYGFSTSTQSASSVEAKISKSQVSKENKDPTTTKNVKTCPFYKKMPGTNFAVDAFCYGKIPGITGYFLSHFHADHYMGLTSKFSHGKIYCSSVTANLVKQQLRVPTEYIHVLPMEEMVDIEGVQVYLIDANHCPGSVIFIFIVPQKNSPLHILHTGDFRAHKRHVDHPAIKNASPFDIIYLDTTYCKPQYRLPAQDEMVKQVGELCYLLHSKNATPNPMILMQRKILFCVGTYLIGKERVFIEVASRLNSLIYADNRKTKILNCQENRDISEKLTCDPRLAQVHVVQMNRLNIDDLTKHLEIYKEKFDTLVAFKPTGWALSSHSLKSKIPEWLKGSLLGYEQLKVTAVSKDNRIALISVPYSEHSSFDELEMFVKGIDCKRIIPTVNIGTESARSTMQKWFSQWKSAGKRK